MNARVSVLEGDYIDGNSVDPDLDAAFAAFRDELHEGQRLEGTLSAYKVPMDKDGNTIAKSQKQAFLFSCPVDSVSLIDIINRCKRDFMREGEMRMTVRLAGTRTGVGRRGSEFNKIIYIEKENEAPKAPSGSPDIVTLMRTMAEMNQAAIQRQEAFTQRLMEMQMQIAQARATPAPAAPGMSDPMSFMMKMMEMQAMINRFLPMISAPAAPAVPATPQGNSLLDTIKVLKEMQTLLPSGAPATEEDDGIMSGIAKLAGPAMALMAENERTKRALIERGGGRRIARATTATPVIQPAEEGAPATTSAPSTTEGTDMSLMMFREQLKALCEIAAEGTPAVDAAEMVMEQIPEEYDNQLEELVCDENKAAFQTKIGTLYAGCKNHAAWFEELRVAIAAEFSDPDQAPNA